MLSSIGNQGNATLDQTEIPFYNHLIGKNQEIWLYQLLEKTGINRMSYIAGGNVIWYSFRKQSGISL